MYKDPDRIIRAFQEAKQLRSGEESDWRAAAAHCLPRHYGAWQSFESPSALNGSSAAAARLIAVDITAAKAVPVYTSVLQRLATPRSQMWHNLQPSNPDLLRYRRVELYFAELNRLLWQQRYHPRARFSTAQTENYVGVGVYGNGVKFISSRKRRPGERRGGLLYRSPPLMHIYVLRDDEGEITHFFRAMWLNARQFKLKFPGVTPPPSIEQELEKQLGPSESTLFLILHLVCPNDQDHDPDRIDYRRFKYASVYVSEKDRSLIGEPSGYAEKPYVLSRTFTEPDGTYGFSPALRALGAMGSLSAMKRTLLKAGQKAVDPVLLAHDDGIISGRKDLRPGAVMFGGVDAQGRELVKTLQTGNFVLAEKMMEAEKRDVEDVFLVTLFQILMDNPQMTATQVMENIAEKAALVAPTLERLQEEDIGPTIERELSVLGEENLLPEMPGELIEAEGEYELIHTSPMSKAQASEESAGFMRLSEFTAAAAETQQNPRLMRRLNFDKAIPAMARTANVPPEWLRSDEELAAEDDQQQQERDIQTAIEAAPAVAGLAKAVSANR